MQENLKFEVSLIEKKNSDSTLLYVPNVLLVLSFDMLQHCHNQNYVSNILNLDCKATILFEVYND